MKFKLYFLLLLIIPLASFKSHKYYISLCEIEHVKDQNSIQITLGLFIDDIELTLNKNHNIKFNLDTENEIENIEDYYEKYLNKHFEIEVNHELKPYTFIGKEYDEDIVRFYLEINSVNQIKSISVKNTSLFQYFEDQQNIIKIYANNKHKTFYLNQKNDKGLLNF